MNRLRTTDAARIEDVLMNSVTASNEDEDRYWCWLVKHEPGRARVHACARRSASPWDAWRRNQAPFSGVHGH